MPISVNTPVVTSSIPAGCSESNGYLHPQYAASLAEFGQPLVLPQSRSWLLKRRIPGTELFDAMGCYPLFCCADWNSLSNDIARDESGLVSLALVTDPFGNYDAEHLKKWFDLVVRYKEHFACELAQDPGVFVSKHHRYYARSALKHATVEIVGNPTEHLDEWVELYATLTRRHELKGIKAFSRDTFLKQLQVPGLVMLRISAAGVCLGAHLWFIQNGVAYSHLMALSEAGYSANSSYGLYWRAIEIFKASFSSSVRILDFGSGAGIAEEKDDGLARFKRGWSTCTRSAWFCGKILNRAAYAQLAQATGCGETTYFPAYRKGEFA